MDDNYHTLKCRNMTSIKLKSQIKMISYNINHIIMNQELLQLGAQEIKNQLFNICFLIQDISFNDTFRNMKF